MRCLEGGPPQLGGYLPPKPKPTRRLLASRAAERDAPGAEPVYKVAEVPAGESKPPNDIRRGEKT